MIAKHLETSEETKTETKAKTCGDTFTWGKWGVTSGAKGLVRKGCRETCSASLRFDLDCTEALALDTAQVESPLSSSPESRPRGGVGGGVGGGGGVGVGGGGRVGGRLKSRLGSHPEKPPPLTFSASMTHATAPTTASPSTSPYPATSGHGTPGHRTSGHGTSGPARAPSTAPLKPAAERARARARWEGLVLVPAENASGFKGVVLHHKRFRAVYWRRGQKKHLGTFATAEEVAPKLAYACPLNPTCHPPSSIPLSPHPSVPPRQPPLEPPPPTPR